MRIFLILLALLPTFAFAQIGGRNVYDFLNLAPQARVAGLGGVNITTIDYDHNFAFQNPAVLNDSMHNRASFSFVDYFAGITYGYASYARSFEGIGDFHAGFQFVNYGKQTAADVYGNQTGTFKAGDLAFVVGGARQVGNYRIGTNLKFINSSIAGYNSWTALALDLGGTYLSDDQLFSAALVFKNMGVQLGPYVQGGPHEPIPFEMQAGISYKLEHMPLRFSVTGIQLQRPKLIYVDPNPEPQYDLSGELIKPKSTTVDNIFRHLVFGGEFVISRGFNLRFGYNHMRRQELRSVNRAGISGFSFGVGIRIKKIHLDYSFAGYHAIGGTNHFSVSTELDNFKKKK
ncbi:MAG: type IX secretion system protein PorQ [Bacteroidia bacterium]|nr:type IX secretion system protein PorQ [Bacteroidia bacterium]